MGATVVVVGPVVVVARLVVVGGLVVVVVVEVVLLSENLHFPPCLASSLLIQPAPSTIAARNTHQCIW